MMGQENIKKYQKKLLLRYRSKIDDLNHIHHLYFAPPPIGGDPVGISDVQMCDFYNIP